MAILIFTAPRVKDGSKKKLWIRAGFPVLIFSFFLPACFDKDPVKNLTIQWNQTRATGLVIPRIYLPNIPDDSIKNTLTVHLVQSGDQPAMLGEYRVMVDLVVFEPLIVLTRGLNYDVRFRNQSLGKVLIPLAESDRSPEVEQVFPTPDSLPENLLKIYIQFSSPMREDQSLDHLVLIRNETDTIQSAFLPLQQELWNKERTILTVWLHPGRIKRDLQPNIKYGVPLEKGGSYRFIVKSEWEDINGKSLNQSYQKKFAVFARDSVSPNPDHWLVTCPVAETKNPLNLKFDEPLVYTLIQESIELYDTENKLMDGRLTVSEKETGLSFIPSAPWKKGRHYILIQSRLEDLAGNNLKRLFDRDISVVRQEPGPDSVEIRFEVN